jgi:hypothetical protein
MSELDFMLTNMYMSENRSVVYGYSSSYICGGAVWGCYRKSRDRNGPDRMSRKCVLRMRNQKLRNTPYWGLFTRSDVSHVTGRGPDRGVTGSMFCACPVPPAFFSYYSSSTSTMATGSDRKSGDPFGVPFCVRMRDLKCPWGVL